MDKKTATSAKKGLKISKCGKRLNPQDPGYKKGQKKEEAGK
jgi:hypothetical protein